MRAPRIKRDEPKKGTRVLEVVEEHSWWSHDRERHGKFVTMTRKSKA